MHVTSDFDSIADIDFVDVIIIGGGISGLSAAYELERRGIPFTLLEASPRLGGLIRTEHLDGFTVEAGPESVLAQKPAALQLCEELGLGPRISDLAPAAHARSSCTAAAGSGALPFAARHSADVAGLARLRPAAADAPARGSRSSRSFRARDAPATSRSPRSSRGDSDARPCRSSRPRSWAAYTRAASTRLSMHSLFPRFVEAETNRGSVLRAFRHSHAGVATDGAFRSLSSGMGELVSAIGRRLPPGSVRLASGAGTLSKADDVWRVGTPQGNVDARSVVLAAPAYAAARLLVSVDHGVVVALRRGSVRLERERNAGLLARAGRAPASRLAASSSPGPGTPRD